MKKKGEKRERLRRKGGMEKKMVEKGRKMG